MINMTWFEIHLNFEKTTAAQKKQLKKDAQKIAQMLKADSYYAR